MNDSAIDGEYWDRRRQDKKGRARTMRYTGLAEINIGTSVREDSGAGLVISETPLDADVGEALHIGKLAPFAERYPAVELINMYGITETTVHVTYKKITKMKKSNVPKVERKRKMSRDKRAPAKRFEKGMDCLFSECEKCGSVASHVDLEENSFVCRVCGCHMKLSAQGWIAFLADAGSFEETNGQIGFVDPIFFPGYEEKYLSAKGKTRLNEAVLTGLARIDGRAVALGVMESNFIMGSMGVVLGEKVARLFELAIAERCPAVMVTASGGARMQEGIAALLQMSKTASVVGQLNESGIPLICILTSPTTGGVSASFAMLGDIILAEPDALIGFAGPRVIRQTIRQELPEGFQKSEHLLQCGFVDKIVPRNELKDVLRLLVDAHSQRGLPLQPTTQNFCVLLPRSGNKLL
jgi:acetyl-CoA carboxylase carboxyl transferase subunit beta